MSLLIDALKKASDARGLRHEAVTDSIPDVAPDDYLGQKPAPPRVPSVAAPVPPANLNLTQTDIPAAKVTAGPARSELTLTLEEIKPTENKISIEDRLAVASTAPQIELITPDEPPAVSSESVAVTVPVQSVQSAPIKDSLAADEARKTPVGEPPKKPEPVLTAPAARASAVHVGNGGARSRHTLPKAKLVILGVSIALLSSIGAASYYYYQQQMAALSFVPMVPIPGRLSPLQPLSPPPLAETTVSEPVTENTAKVVPPRRGSEKLKPLASGEPVESVLSPDAARPTRSRKIAHADVNLPEHVPTRMAPNANRENAKEIVLSPFEGGIGGRDVSTVNGPVNAPPVPVAELQKHSEPIFVAPQPIARAESREDSVEILLEKAYAAYRAGDWERATTSYRKALNSDSQNRDALLGLAAIAARNGDMAQASDFYARLLMRDAKDAVALAGFVSVVGSLDPIRAQSELKTMMQQNPAAAFLHFALGNVYVAQLRWADAEAEFFSAFRMDSTNPDYAYNLAISLDKLGQRDSALRYYQSALENAKLSTARFDLTAVEQRVKAIAMGAGRTGS